MSRQGRPVETGPVSAVSETSTRQTSRNKTSTTHAARDGRPLDVRSRIKSGFAWGLANALGSQVTRTLAAIALARLLSPRDYGLANMAIIFTSLGIVFTDLSFGAALVQRKRVTEDDRSTLFWTGLAAGTILTVVGVSVSGVVARFYHAPAVQPLFAVLSVVFVLGSLQVIQAAILHREMRFREQNLRLFAAVIIGAAAGVLGAAAGLGAWALIVQQVVVSTVSVLLLWRTTDWRPRFVFSVNSLRNLGGYSARLTTARSVDYLNRNGDNLLIGRFLGSTALGAYAVAYNIMLLPLTRLILPIQDAVFPAFARWQDDRKRVAAVWLRVNVVVAAAVVPAMLGLVVLAPDFVDTVLGKKWNATVPVLQILAGVAILQAIAMLGDCVLQAFDHTKTILRFSLVELAITLPAFGLGLRWGIVGVAICYGVVNLVLRPAYVLITTRILGISFWSLPRCLAGVGQISAVMTAAVWATRAFLVREGVPPAARLVLCIAVGVVAYIPLAAWRLPDLLLELRHGVAAFRARATAPAAEVAA